MSKQSNIAWWSENTPALENWLPSQKPSKTDKELLDKHASSDFHQELIPFISEQNLPVINGIAENTNRRIANSFTDYRRWLIYSAGIGIIALLIILSVATFNNPDSRVEANNAPEEQEQASAPIINKNDPNTDNSTVTADNGIQEEVHQTEEKRNPIITDGDTHFDSEQSTQTPDLSQEEDSSPENEKVESGDTADDNSEGTDSKSSSSEQDRENKKSAKKDDSSGFRLSGGGQTSKPARDSNIPLTLKEVVIGHTQNLWVREKSQSTSGKISDGQLGGSTTNSTSASFAPGDMPSYHGGDERLKEHLALNVRMNTLNKKYNQPVSAVASFVVDHRGKVKDIQIMSTSSREIKDAITKAINELGRWKKGNKIGKKGSVYYEIIFSFD